MLVTFYNEVSSVNETNENSYIYIFTVPIIQKKKKNSEFSVYVQRALTNVE